MPGDDLLENSGLDTKLQSELLASGIVKQYSEGDVIINEGSFIRSIPIVLEGNIKVIRLDSEGREILLYYIGKFESCIMSFLAGSCNCSSGIKAVAEDNVEVLMIPFEKASELIKNNVSWSEFVFNLYQKRFDELLNVINSIAFKKTDSRLIDYLNKKSAVLDSKKLSITHEEIAMIWAPPG
jgi:CRP/FNR family transcriptional regulator, anaerobic regulatory protein